MAINFSTDQMKRRSNLAKAADASGEQYIPSSINNAATSQIGTSNVQAPTARTSSAPTPMAQAMANVAKFGNSGISAANINGTANSRPSPMTTAPTTMTPRKGVPTQNTAEYQAGYQAATDAANSQASGYTGTDGSIPGALTPGNPPASGSSQFGGQWGTMASEILNGENSPASDSYWQSLRDSTNAAIDKQYASESAATQKQYAAMGGGFGSNLVQGRGQNAYQAALSKGQAAAEIAQQEAKAKTDLLNVLMGYASAEEQNTLNWYIAEEQTKADAAKYGVDIAQLSNSERAVAQSAASDYMLSSMGQDERNSMESSWSGTTGESQSTSSTYMYNGYIYRTSSGGSTYWWNGTSWVKVS